MGDFEKVISGAKDALPGAFEVGGSLPYSSRIRPLASSPTGGIDIGRDLDEDTLLPSRNEQPQQLEEANRELGFDAIAFYISFHRPTHTGEWGIYYWDHRVRQLAAVVMRDLHIADPRLAANVAFEIVRKHEYFHFRFDVFSLHQELTLGRALYNNYSKTVYRKVLCTGECFEEALANRSSARGKYGLSTAVSPSVLKNFIEELCSKAPPGYRDFNRPVNELRSGLGGQLLSGTAAGRMGEPNERWVGNAGPYSSVRCPENVLVNLPTVSAHVVQLRIKIYGHIWDFHRNDRDRWPSHPHGHDYDHHCKLSLSDGTIYDSKTRKAIGRERTKHLIELRNRLEIKWPDVTMPPLVVAGAK